MAENEKTTEKPADPQMPKEFRENFDRIQAENAALKDTLRSTAFTTAGLDPNKGVGKAVATLYDGYDPAEITRIATEEFEWSGSTPSGPSSTEQQVAAATQRVNEVVTGSTSVAPQDLQKQIDEAEREGRWDEAIRLKVSRMTPS